MGEASDWKERGDTWWRTHLDPEQYKVLRKRDTEQPFTGKYLKNEESGVYVCAGCGQALFLSGDKYDSGSGWPSFTVAAAENAISLREDHSLGVARQEVLCSRCGGHLGHVFDDGPAPGGKRYCVNSASLDFKLERGARSAEREDPPGTKKESSP